MSLLSAIKGFFAVAPKTANDIFDKDNGLLVKTGQWIDGLQYTGQERAKTFAEFVESFKGFFVASLNESTERSQARRSIALLWVKFQIFLLLLTALSIPVKWVFPQFAGMAKDYFDLATCDVMVYGTFAVLAFFFGPYMFGAHISRKTGAEKG